MRLVVAGAAGRMGRALVQIVHGPKARPSSAPSQRPGSLAIGQDAGLLAGCGKAGVEITADALSAIVDADGLLDFTTPQTTVALAALAAQARIVHVVGTTGLQPQDFARLEAAARHAVVVQSGNMSLGVNLLAALVERAARTLGPDFDIEIMEMHHRAKVDAPSGTALLLGAAAAKGRSSILPQKRACRATAIPARGRKGRSASPRCAAARSSAITGLYSPEPAKGSNSRMSRKTAAFSRAAPSRRRFGARAASRAFIR